MKNVIRTFLIIVVLLILSIWVFNIAFAGALTNNDKYDGDCPQPYTTVGRCADKCPNASDTLLGYDKQTGAAQCKPADIPTVTPSITETPTLQNVPDTELPQFSVDKAVDSGDNFTGK